jgi:hypothetical protein
MFLFEKNTFIEKVKFEEEANKDQNQLPTIG